MDFLNNVHLYLLVQRAIGADRLRTRALDRLAAREGERILDVGCGPAYYVSDMPDIDYVGFDTQDNYIAYARKHYGSSRRQFHCSTFDESKAAGMARFDGVLLMGLLHHLDDAECHALLSLLKKMMKPDGRLVALDTCFTDNQNVISRWVSEHDRGEFVRTVPAFRNFYDMHFAKVDVEILDKTCRLPSAFVLATMSAPRP